MPQLAVLKRRMAEPLSRIRYLKTAASMAFDALREGRLPLSPRRWLLDLRHLRQQLANGAGSAMSSPQAPGPRESASAAQALAESCRLALTAFMRCRTRIALCFLTTDRLYQVLIVLHNRAELTLRCLQRLREHLSVPIDSSSSTTIRPTRRSALLDRVHGAQIIRPGENLRISSGLQPGSARGARRVSALPQQRH